MSNTESFESIVNAAMEKVHDNYEIKAIEVAGILGTLSGAHDREIRDTAQREFARGMDAGKHNMDAEHRAIAMRLRALPLDGGSHENLSQIARAVYHSDFGWTKGACMSLRDELVRLMGGVSDDTCACAGGGACDADCGRDSGEQVEVTDGRVAHDCADDSRGGYRGVPIHMDGLTTYDVLGNERQKAVCELRKLTINGDYYGNYQRIALAIGTVYDGESFASECVRDRLIHLLGGDQPSGIDVMNSYEQRIEKLQRQRDEAREERDELRVRLDTCYRRKGAEDVVRGITLGTYSMTEGIEKLERIYGGD